MALELGSIHHIAILVDDLAAAEAFYAGILGFRVERRWPDEQGGTRSVWLAIGHDALLMLERADPEAPRAGEAAGGWHLLAFTIDAKNRTRVEAELSRKRVPIESRTDYTLYVRDPEGNRVAFSHWPHPVPQRP